MSLFLLALAATVHRHFARRLVNSVRFTGVPPPEEMRITE